MCCSVLAVIRCHVASLVTQMVKNPPAMQETQIQSLGWEDPLEKGLATHSSILARRIPWTEEESRGLYSPRGRKVSETTEQLTLRLRKISMCVCVCSFQFHPQLLSQL